MHSIVIIGYMGSGKSTVARQLSQRMNMQLLDTDQEIEKSKQCTIREIFAKDGEEVFRKYETEMLLKICENQFSGVLSTGGGMPLLPKNQEYMHTLGTVVYLRAQSNTIYQRISKDQSRPLLNQKDKMTEIERMLKVRNPIYEATADIVIDTDELEPQEITERIIKLLP